jgi:predicted Fe-S protein YdhL (DUF1289 family)
MKVKSPCIKICKLQDNVCIGCFRHIDEIQNWKHLTNEEKHIILQQLEDRRGTVVRVV